MRLSSTALVAVVAGPMAAASVWASPVARGASAVLTAADAKEASAAAHKTHDYHQNPKRTGSQLQHRSALSGLYHMRPLKRRPSPQEQQQQPAPQATRPPPCEPLSPPPDEAATKARFDAFANAFLVAKNISEAFTYIADSYINHNPAARNGAASAWGILSPIWGSQSITVLRTTFKGNMGWLNYRTGGFGEVVDRYRWDAGCIMEHWDRGERYPSDAT